MKKYKLHSGFDNEIPREYSGEKIQRIVGYRTKTDGPVVGMDAMVTALDHSTLSKEFKPVGSFVPCSEFVPGQAKYYNISNGGWITDLGNERYITNWTAEERWCRVEEIEFDDENNIISSHNIGFVIRRVDRSKGLL